MRTTAKVKGILLAAALLPLCALAQDPIGRVLATKGPVSARDANGSIRPLTRRNTLFEQDTLLTGADGFLSVRFADDAQLSLGANSEMTIHRYRFDADPATPDAVLMTLARGCFRTVSGTISGPPGEHRIETPVAFIDVRGTFHEATYDGGTLYTSTLNGGTTIINAQGTLDVGIGGDYDFSRTSAGTPPEGLIDRPAQLDACTNLESTQSASQPNGLITPTRDQDYSTGPVVSPSAAPSSPADVRPGP